MNGIEWTNFQLLIGLGDSEIPNAISPYDEVESGHGTVLKEGNAFKILYQAIDSGSTSRVMYCDWG